MKKRREEGTGGRNERREVGREVKGRKEKRMSTHCVEYSFPQQGYRSEQELMKFHFTAIKY
jgi:hypothetical protein